MAFRQDTDPGSVKSLLALLRSNQTQTPSPSATTPPPLNPFFSTQPQSNPIVPPASSLQDLLETLRRANDSPQPQPQPGPSFGAGYRDDGGRQGPRDAKRRRIEPSSIDPYAEEHGESNHAEDEEEEEEEQEGVELDRSGSVHRPKDVPEASAWYNPQRSQSETIEPPDKTSHDIGIGSLTEVAGAEEEIADDDDDDRNRYGYTPEQMSNLSLDQGGPIIHELLERQDIISGLKQLKKEQEDLERHMWKKRSDIVEDYRKKLPAERAPNHPDYQKVIKQRTSALLKFYAQRVLPFYDITGKKQLVSLSELGFPCLGDKEKGDEEVGGEVVERRGEVLRLIEGKLGG